MVTLTTKGRATGIGNRVIGRAAICPVPEADRRDAIRVVAQPTSSESLDGYLAVVGGDRSVPVAIPAILGCSVEHLQDGDVLGLDSRGCVHTLYRCASSSNTLLATERCNCRCIMCSQPPKEDDERGRIEELLRIVTLIPPTARELGISGGEPTLLGDGLLTVIAACRDALPRTALHLLSNGRRFSSVSYSRALSAVGHPDLMVGVALNSDLDSEHDYIVQASGAFDETVRGLYQLALRNVPIEIRVVIQKHNWRRLPQLSHFIYRNLTFARHITFMGLEVIGHARANIDAVWVDPADYADTLAESVEMLATAGMNVSIYNHQLCTLPRNMWPFNRCSISDWKVRFGPECAGCSVREECGGFFKWNVEGYQSRATRAMKN